MVALKATQHAISLAFQLLIVPVLDNTSMHPSWSENEHTPSLTPAKMLWFRTQYLPVESERSEWTASPILAPGEMFERVPDAWIGVCELDVLRDEGVRYGELMRQFGRTVEIKVYQGAPHPIMANDQVSRSLCGVVWD